MGDYSTILKAVAADAGSAVKAGAKSGYGKIKKIPGKIDDLAGAASISVMGSAMTSSASPEAMVKAAEAARRGVKYGIYGAAGAGTVGAAVGLVNQDTTVAGGALGGAGLGAVGGAGAGAVAAAIAKSIR